MFKQNVPQNEVALRILKAADVLMAREGVQNLSTHKIAKEAGVSVGTIYLYFKDKDHLLNQLVLYLFDAFQTAIDQEYHADLPLFEQYQKLWHASWQFMLDNPNIVKNMHQYESLLQFQTTMKNCMSVEELPWNTFIKRGQSQKIIASLPPFVLYAISMRTAWELMYQQMMLEQSYSSEMIDEVILRTWKAITI
ncbi:TetR/AcrR family transcriptional regulator [Actinobacillus indolicus]|uniref:TetR/AcrR family transcriptional regulator n=1 Tax=Actinobacillus indolicus TaxID=51049 RepID=A0A4P7CHL5_9PAST|nr:TetR/AcrR family transcriptional regulator [Actinobacillus indolicus]QBQ64573.1 TetR/AcrR family transcriptional regulator [Actinobacillus indolicus]